MTTEYSIIVRGRLDEAWASEFDEIRVSARPDGTTALVGPVRDQNELHGRIRRVVELGLTLVAVQEAGEPR